MILSRRWPFSIVITLLCIPQPSLAAAPPAEVRSGIQRVIGALEAWEGLLNEQFDIVAVSRSAGQDPQKLLLWAHDNTAEVPYQGILRGAEGVLIDRRGNSLDRALLLAEMLRAGNATVRLARATLTPQQAATLDPGQAKMPAFAPVTQELLGRSKEAAADLRRAAGMAQPPRDESAQRQAAARIKQLVKAVDEQSAALLEALDQRRLLADGADDPAQVKARCDHWWVQVRSADGKWLDCDPSLANPSPGQSVARAQGTFEIDKLRADLYHTVTITLVIEQRRGQKLQEQRGLSAILRPARLHGKQIVLRHFPVDWDKAPKDGPYAQRLLGQKRWMPCLSVGDQTYFGREVELVGGAESGSPAGAVGGMGRSTLGGFGGGLGGGEAKRVAGLSVTAEWLDIEIVSPGCPKRTIRRQIFDAIGPAARANGQWVRIAESEAAKVVATAHLGGTIQIGIFSAATSPEYWLRQWVRSQLAGKDAWLAIASQPDVARRAELARAQAARESIAMARLYFYDATRGALAGDTGQVFRNTPNVIDLHVLPGAGGTGKSAVIVDVVDNQVAVSAGAKAPARLRLRQGVADTAAETLVLPLSGPVPSNALLLFADMPRNNTVLLTSSAEVSKELSAWPVDPLARASLDMAKSRAILASRNAALSSRSPRFAWWKVDLTTGQTIGVIDSGYHSATVEDTLVRNQTGTVRISEAAYQRWLSQQSPETLKLIGDKPLEYFGNSWEFIYKDLGLKFARYGGTDIDILCEISETFYYCRFGMMLI